MHGDGWSARVFLGSVLGDASPVETHTPLLGAEITLAEGTTLEIPVDPSYEHGVLVDTGALTLDGTSVKPSQLAFVPVGADRLVLHASDETRLLLLGGTPLGERIVMWWNFVGRDHDEIAEYRRAVAGAPRRRGPGPLRAARRRPLPRDPGAGAAARGAAHAARVRRGAGLSPRGTRLGA